MRRRYHMLTIAAMLLLTSQPSFPADLSPLSGSELHERCRAYASAPHSTEGRSCAAYIRGFIEGSTLVQLHTSETAVTQQESFSERAFRTRLGLRSSAQPLYCVDRTMSLSRFIMQMLAHLDERPRERDANAGDVLYSTLQRFYRCSA